MIRSMPVIRQYSVTVFVIEFTGGDRNRRHSPEEGRQL